MHSLKKVGLHWLLILGLLCPGSAIAQRFSDVLEMDLVVHIIDVGIGDAIFIELPNREHEVVIDGGDIRRGYNFLDYISASVDEPVELAIITHPDFGHWSGIARLIETFAVERLWDPGYGRDCRFTGVNGAEKKNRDAYLKFIHNIPAEQVQLQRPAVVDPEQAALEMDGVKFWILHSNDDPQGPDCADIINNASIVVKMQYKQTAFLFAGDGNGLERYDAGNAEPKYVEAKLLAIEEKHPGILHADVLKVPNHGSSSASSIRFIKAVAPAYAVISSSSTARDHLPSRRVVRRYLAIRYNETGKIKKVLRTSYREKDHDNRRFGDDHIICGTNGEPQDLICDYIWNFE